MLIPSEIQAHWPSIAAEGTLGLKPQELIVVDIHRVNRFPPDRESVEQRVRGHCLRFTPDLVPLAELAPDRPLVGSAFLDPAYRDMPDRLAVTLIVTRHAVRRGRAAAPAGAARRA